MVWVMPAPGGPNSTTSYSLDVPPEPIKQGTSFLMTATFHNGTGQDILTMEPDCYNTTFTVRDLAGNILPPRDRIRKAYGIPDDLVPISNNTDSSVTCNLLELFAPEVLIPGAYTVQATYSNHIQDPNLVGGVCHAPPGQQCYNLWMGAIHSTEVPTTVIPVTGFYVVTPSAGPNGSIDPSTPQVVSPGGIVSFTMTPTTGYHIASVSGCNGSLVGNTYTTGAITADCNVAASFAINTYTLTYTAGPNGTISGASSQTVSYGQSGSAVTAVPNTGYHFVQWSDGVLTTSRTDTKVTANINVTARLCDQHLQADVHGGAERHYFRHIAADGKLRPIWQRRDGGSQCWLSLCQLE